MSERVKRRAAWAGLLLGVALLLVAAAWLVAPRPQHGAPIAPRAARASSPGSDRSAMVASASERAAPPERSALGAGRSDESPARSAAAQDAPAPVVEAGPNERNLYQLYLARLAHDPDALAREAEAVLSGDGPRNRRVALLRAAWDLGLPGAPQLFQQALRSPTDDADRHAASLADFALRFLVRRAAREPLAWTTLFDAVQLGATRMQPRLRRTAAGQLVQAAAADDLSRLVALAQEEPDSDVARSLIGALRTRGDETARAALRELGLDDAVLAPSPEEDEERR